MDAEVHKHTEGHRFVNGGEVKNVRGKSKYPDFLRLYINRSEALSFAMDILRQLEHQRQNASELIEIPLFGKLERVTEDDIKE